MLQSILEYLEEQKNRGKLNNNGIPRMVRGYFYEMACVIAECHRVLIPGALLFAANRWACTVVSRYESAFMCGESNMIRA